MRGGTTTKLHNGYSVEILKDGVKFEEHSDVNPLHIIERKEADKWDIQITAPANLSREVIASTFSQIFAKELKKEDFERAKGGVLSGVPLATITINLATLAQAPDLKLLTLPNGQLKMVTAEQMREIEARQQGRQAPAPNGQYL